MPEIKNTFLGGKMNKSLDDRLLPEGEYRDALNAQITKNHDGGSDVGVVHNIKSNLLLTSETYNANPVVLGSFFEEQNNRIFYFVKDDSNNYIKIYNKSDGSVDTLASGAYLAFDGTKKITGINVAEDTLFWVDNVNEPRKIKISDALNSNIDYTLAENLSILKLAPYKAPEITSTFDAAVTGEFLKEKFGRFAYRFKFKDNTYSVISPFSHIAFDVATGGSESNYLSGDQLSNAYKSGTLEEMVNSSNKFTLKLFLPHRNIIDETGATAATLDKFNIESIDIILKTTDLPAAYIVDTITDPTILSNGTDDYAEYIYKSTKPKVALPEEQLIRVYDNAPTKALAQEFVGNRIVYGNFTENVPATADNKLNFSVAQSSIAAGAAGEHFGVKLKRTYEVGVVLSDAFGRSSTVLTSRTNEGLIYLDTDAVDPDYTDLLKRLTITFGDISDIPNKWLYYSIVIKQTEQEYYNIYTPGFGFYKGKTYTTLFGDNINKLPIDTSTYNADTNINSTTTKVSLSLENQSYFVREAQAGVGQSIYAIGYRVQNSSFTTSYSMGNYTPKDKYSFTATAGQQNFVITRKFDAYFGDMGASGVVMASSPVVYVNGVLSSATANDSTNTITLTTAAEEGDIVEIFPTFSGITIYPGQDRIGYSLSQTGTPTTPDPTYITITQSGDSLPVSIYAEGQQISNEDYIYTITTQDPLQRELNDIKVTGISTLNNFNSIPDNIKDTSYDLYETTFYKKQNSYLIAEFDGEFGVNLNDLDNGNFKGKVASLGILETKPFESSLDIYYETATQGLIEDITVSPIVIDYYNCINFNIDGVNEGFQEARIKGGFNENFIDNGVQAYLVNPDYREITRTNTLIYSGILNPRTGVDNTNQFPSGVDITKSLDPVNGSIQKLFAEDDDLDIFQEERVSRALIDKDIIYTAEGGPISTLGRVVIGEIQSYGTKFGIGKNPESFAYYAGRKYFADKPKGAILRLSRDGITEISNYGMSSYFRDNLKDATAIYGMWDMYTKEYVVAVEKALEANSFTVAYDESVNGWTTFYSYKPENGGSLDSSFYTFKNAQLWEHYEGVGYNTFYGTLSPADTHIEFIFNQNPSSSKNFLTINYEGTDTWNIIDITTDTDSAEEITAYNINNEDLIISSFKKYDNKYYSNLFNKTTSNNNEVVFGNNMSGIKGYFAKMKIKTNAADYKELFSVSTNYNINSY